MSLDVKGFLKQLFTASETDKDGIISEFQGDVDRARIQLDGAEQALTMVHNLLGRNAPQAPAPAVPGAKLNGHTPAGTRKPRNGSSGLGDQELVTVFDLIQGGTGKIGDLMERTGQDRVHLKKVLGALSDRDLVEMSGFKGGARYHVKPGAVRPAIRQTAPSASSGETEATHQPEPSAAPPEEAPAASSSQGTPAPVPQAAPAGDQGPTPETASTGGQEPAPEPAPTASNASAPVPASNSAASPSSASGTAEAEADPKGKPRRTQPQHARR